MRELTRDEWRAFVSEGTRTGKLATASPTGAVHVAPVWFVVTAEALVFTTYQDTVKARHLTANPRAALTADEERFPYGFVLVRGAVEIDRTAPDLGDWTHRLAARYVPVERAEEYGRRNAVEGEWLCRLRLDKVIGRAALAD